MSEAEKEVGSEEMEKAQRMHAKLRREWRKWREQSFCS